MDFVVLQIAKRRGVPVTPGEEVLIDAQNLRTSAADPFPGQQLQIPLKPAFHRGARQTLALGQGRAADAVEMLLADAAPKRLCGSYTRLNPRKALPEAAATRPAQPL